MNIDATDEAAPGAELGILKALADESRLTILGLVARQERSVSELAALLAVKASTVSHHLAKLRVARLVGMRSAGTTHYYRLDTTGLARLRAGLRTPERIASLTANAAGVGAAVAETKVLANFLEGERLKEIPASLKKRQVILRWLAADFESGRDYPEKELNEIIGRRHPDFATLRRELIVNGLLTRTKGIYRRA